MMIKTVSKSKKSPRVIVDLQFMSPLWKTLSLDLKKISRQLARDVLTDFNLSALSPDVPRQLTIVLSDNEHLQSLNTTYRQQNKPTNILSFAYGEEALSQGLLGDLFLSFECLQREADDQQKSVENHFSHLLIHGILHLLGYDHEDPTEALVMENLEIQFLKKRNIPNPYEADLWDHSSQNLTREV